MKKTDWQETIINNRTVYYNYFNGMEDLPDSEIEHIQEMLEQGYVEGELNYYDVQLDEEIRGWWTTITKETNH